MPVAPVRVALPVGYASLLADIKKHLVQARLRTVLAANVALTQAYWQIGQTILARQAAEGWGAKLIDRLSADLREAFPDMGGLSPRNLLSMKLFAEAFPEPEITKQPVSQLPWGHIILLLQKVKSASTRLWYIKANIEYGWSRNVLALQIAALALGTRVARQNRRGRRRPDDQLILDPLAGIFRKAPMLQSGVSKLALCMAGILTLLVAGRVSADPVFASWDPASADSASGTLDGVGFTVTGLSSVSLSTANLTSGNFSAAPGGSSEQALFYAEKSNFTVTFASPIADLYLYGYYWRPENLVDYSFTQPISILSGFATATVNNGTDLVATNADDYLNGIVELTNVTSFTVTQNFTDSGRQLLDFATPVPEPGSFGLLALGASCLLFGGVRRSRNNS